MRKRESELKFTCEAFAADFIKRGVDSVCLADDDFSENIISSVYFDTDEWSFAMEKAASDFLKSKVRLRWYQESGNALTEKSSKCYLEFKWKEGSKRMKERILMPFNGAEALNAIQQDEIKSLIAEHVSIRLPEYSAYSIKPKFVVSYSRSRYIEPFSQTRISFDRNIHAYNVGRNYAQFSSKVALDEAVLEVKGDCEDLPIALRRIHAGALKKAAFSKYYESFKLLSGYEQ